LLGENALSDDVLDIINSDLDPEMSIQDAKDWSQISSDPTNYDAVAIDLTEKERYDIAVQNEFDKTEYNDHIKWLDTQEIKEVNTRVQELVNIGKNLNDAQITELSNLADRQQKFATSASVDAEVNNFVDDLYGDANKAITDARNEQARVAKEQADATKKALEEAKAEQARKAEVARKAEQARQAEAKRKADAEKKRKEEERIRIQQQIAVENASRQATNHAIQQARDFGSGIGTYRGGSGNTMLSGGYHLFCWVAREVYGSDNPKWLEFRDWMLNDAPSNIRESYFEHGESIARHISDKPELKSKIRRFMDSKIGG
jgi:membrane protein involved in colicin uptake